MLNLGIMHILPEIFLVLLGMLLLVVGVFKGNRFTGVLSKLSYIGFAVAIFMVVKTGSDLVYVLNDSLVLDKFAIFLKLLILLGLIVSLVLSVQYLYQERIARFEYPVLIIFAGVGMMFMLSANNMLSLYMSLELQALSLYILAAFHRNSSRSGEAAVKYFILGALSSGMLLFGISLIYGFAGSVNFDTIQSALSSFDNIPPGFTIGMVFVLAAIAFKISAVPFHMWTPDVYQGAPTCVTAFFAIVPKIAVLGLLMRLLFIPFEAASDQWVQILYFMSVASLVIGAFAGIVQDNIKRLFAYSSIGNMGYALIGVIAGTPQGVGSVIAFLTIYLVMNAGAFAIILSMRRNGLAVEKISDLAGFSKTNPVMAYAMAMIMFSMSGIPPLAGFFGKLFIFQAAIESELYVLAVLGVLASVVAAYYYLRIIKVMFFDETALDAFDRDIGFGRRTVLLLSILFILGFILNPDLLLDNAMSAAGSLF